MRKRLLIVVITALISVTANAQAVRKMNSITDTYYGFPNLISTILKTAYQNSGSTQTNFDIGSVGPAGLRSEFMLTDKFGVGVDAWVSNTSISYRDIGSDNLEYDYKVSYLRVLSLFMMNVHFGDSDNLDLYASFGAGYASRKLKFTTDDPNYEDDSFTTPIPVAVRAAFGMRYFFIPNMGVNAAIGLGGPLLSFGVTAKF